MSPVVHIIDDDDELRSALTFLFQSRDVAVQSYSSGEEFLEKFGIEFDGCLLLDVRMKGINRFDPLGQFMVFEKFPKEFLCISFHQLLITLLIDISCLL